MRIMIKKAEDIQTEIMSELRLVNRAGMDNLIAHLCNIGFFKSPASTQHHLCKDGGLAEHSWNVYQVADTMARGLLDFQDYTKLSDSLTLVTLLHDVGKCGQFGLPYYAENILKGGKRSEAKPFEVNKELLPVPHSIVSVSEISKHIELTQEEQFAILCHDGLYGDMKYVIQNKETPLYLLLHSADMLASRVVEIEEGKKDE